jgi:mannosyltransferase OCH1-like enzyme
MLIPRVLNYVWLGSKPMHPLMNKWREEWANLHPAWTVKLWREDPDLPHHMLSCGDEIVECRHPAYLSSCPTCAKRSDVWRYEILEQHGGIYLDTDFEPALPIDDLLAEVVAFAGLCETRYDWTDQDPAGKIKTEVGCSIMGAIPHHPWLRELVRLTPEQDSQAQLALAFPFVTRTVAKHPEVRLFPPVTFYPVQWDQRAMGGGRRALKREPPPEGCYAIHQWSSNWFSGGLEKRT